MVRDAKTYRDPTSALSTPLVHLPGDPIPAPPLLTAEETCRLLRMEVADGASAAERLRYYREKGILPAVSLSGELRFKLVDALRFIDLQQEGVRR